MINGEGVDGSPDGGFTVSDMSMRDERFILENLHSVREGIVQSSGD